MPKSAKVKSGGPNPFIDPAGCNVAADANIEEAMYTAILNEH